MTTMTKDPIVTIEHVVQAKLCTRGARQWFAHNNLDFRDFLTKGLPASVIEGTGDAFGIQVAKIARDEAAEEQHPLGNNL